MSSPPSAPSEPHAAAPVIIPCLAPGCAAAAVAQCRGCLVAVYCSAACAEADWPAHKPACVRAEADRLTAERAAASAAAARDAFDSAVGACAASACARKSIARCTRCRRAGYCGVACQTAHWPAHKAQCKVWSAEAGAAGTMVVYGGGDASRAAQPAGGAGEAAPRVPAAEVSPSPFQPWRKGGLFPSSATVRRWQEAAVRGDRVAQHNVGWSFFRGWHPCEQSDKKASTWWRKAAEAGLADAQYTFGNCYFAGRGVALNFALAASWYAEAAAQGLAQAQYNLGVCYEHGMGVAQDAALVASWFAKEAAQGLAQAQYNLGACYADGTGVAQNAVLAASWCAKAAAQGYAAAQCNLGVCYELGRGVVQDAALAASWDAKAAAQGDADAAAAVARFEVRRSADRA